MQEARCNSLNGRRIWSCMVVVGSSAVPRMPSRLKREPRLSGPSITRTIAGSCQRSRSPLQVLSDGAVLY